jgi:outer membrane lipoprotein-sorting protein
LTGDGAGSGVDTIGAMSTRLWDRAALIPASNGERRPEIVALDAGLPPLDTLFSFMRDAELRWSTLRMRIEERTFGARGEQLVRMDVSIRHPRHARVMTSEPSDGAAAEHELWLSDGETIWTYSATHRLGTKRPVRNRPRGLDDLPATSRVYDPLTPLPMETLPELFVHPAGYCQNVLSTGDCRISGTDRVAGRETILVACLHPRAVERVADRPDFAVEIAVDRLDGAILRLVETIGGEVTRIAEVVSYQPDAPLPPSTFDFEFPEGTTLLF